MAKLKWRVSPRQHGFRRELREWPFAVDAENRVIAIIRCADPYTSDRAKLGNHAALKVYVAVANRPRGKRAAWDYRTLTGTFLNYAVVKVAVQKFYNKNPELFIDEIP